MGELASPRVTKVNILEPQSQGLYVLYWMQHGQRSWNNAAFEHAASWANSLNIPLQVLFVVDFSYPEANARHFAFMLEGIRGAQSLARERGAYFGVRRGDPCEIVAETARDAAVLIMDRGYLRHLVRWRQAVADAVTCRVEMVEGEVIVPVAAASPKQETAARTIRPKIHRIIDQHLEMPDAVTLKRKANGETPTSADELDLSDPIATLRQYGVDDSIGPVRGFTGGESEGRRRLREFVKTTLPRYGDGRADIVNRNVSYLSPYLHFGQLSPLEVYHAVKDADAPDAAKDGFIEEMVIRRELAVNFVANNEAYDRWEAIPQWARDSLALHQSDTREAIYTAQELEDGKTDDPYWNAAMREMRVTGYLHNHMRMYWGKRVLGWMADPQEAHRLLIELNNRYLLDGRDANTYANIAWIFGVHDRGWPEREVYGKVRTMKPSGLKRKFDIDAYVRWANALK